MRTIILITIIGLLFSCSNSKSTSNSKSSSNAKVLIYKTKNNYNQNVPIILSNDKITIISYPHPTDLLVDGKLLLPTQLVDGFLLDNKGINLDVAFVDISYEEYSKLENAPNLEKLMNLILDNSPIIELYDCGFYSDFENLEDEINSIIKSNNLNKFLRIK